MFSQDNDTTIPETLKIGETFESATWRLHRYSNSLHITDIRDAGKRGKRCLKITLVFESCSDCQPSMETAVAMLLPLAGSNASAKTMRIAAQACKIETPFALKLSVHEGVERGVDVRPAGSRGKVEIKGVNVLVDASSDGFMVRCLRDTSNEPTLIQTNKSGCALVLRWVRENASAIQTMTFRDVTEALHAIGAKTHFYCAVD